MLHLHVLGFVIFRRIIEFLFHFFISTVCLYNTYSGKCFLNQSWHIWFWLSPYMLICIFILLCNIWYHVFFILVGIDSFFNILNFSSNCQEYLTELAIDFSESLKFWVSIVYIGRIRIDNGLFIQWHQWTWINHFGNNSFFWQTYIL